MKISFSVIVPLYNKENYICKTIASVLAQSYQNFELIVIDDGSTDGSLKNVVDLSNESEKIRVIHQENQGVSIARNRGIFEARNDYICFLDADDIWNENCLNVYASLIEEYREYSVFCVAQTNYKYNEIFKNGQTVVIMDYCRYNMLVQTSCVCCEKRVFQNVGMFPEKIQMGEDRDMWLRIACKYPIVYKNLDLVAHSVNTENNLSQKHHPLDKTFDYSKWYSYSSDYKQNINKYASRMLLIQAFDEFKVGEIDNVLLLLKKIKRYYYFKRIYLMGLSVFSKYIMCSIAKNERDD